MKKVIIIAYYFPPGPTPANRVLSWIKFLPLSDIYPILITRASDGIESVEKLGNAEIHRIKSDEIHNVRFNKNRFGSILSVLLSKLYSMTFWLSSMDPTYKDFSNYFNKNFGSDDHLLLITGSPFNLFRIGFEYSKDKKGKWIADYRDMWNLSDMPRQFDTFLEKAYRKMIAFNIEKKWIASAHKVTTVSSYLGQKLKSIYNGSITIIENGFFEEEHKDFRNVKKNDILTFVYVGTIYRTQEIDLCIKAIGEACRLEKECAEFIFIGSQLNRHYRKFISEWSNDFLKIKILPKLTKLECLSEQAKCHMGIMCSYGAKGIPASKLYEYIGLYQPVLHFPSDNDIVADTISRAGLGYIYSNYTNAVIGIRELLTNFKIDKTVNCNIDLEFVDKFSRKKLALKIAEEVISS